MGDCTDRVSAVSEARLSLPRETLIDWDSPLLEMGFLTFDVWPGEDSLAKRLGMSMPD